MCDPSGYDASRYADACTVCARAARIIRAAEQKGERFGGFPSGREKTQFWINGNSKEVQEYTVRNFQPPLRSDHGCGGITYHHFDAIIGRWNEFRGPKGCKNCKEICHSLLDNEGNAPVSHVDPYLVMSYCQSREKWFLSAWETVSCHSPSLEAESGWRSKNEVEFMYVGKKTQWEEKGSPRLNNAWIDTNQIRSWIDTCDRTHRESCHPKDTLDPWARKLQSLLMIDVEQNCLTRQTTPCEYVALSYVWGKPKAVFQTTKATLAQLSKRGALKILSWRIPRTVRDSMTFTKAIRQRYLWVDRFSIIQDDENDVDRQINAMAAIYANSYVTIVAEDGNDDAFGLRGLRAQSTLPRKLPWRQLRFDNTTQFISRHRFVARRQNQYHNRAWTFQEYEMSTRKIIFAQGSISWSCRVHDWKECSIFPRILEYQPSNLSSPERTLQWYCLLVGHYNVRLLSNPDDALRAFSSTIATAGRSLVDGILYGIPEVIFDVAIMWEPGIIAYSSTRRRLSADGREQHKFPTWSWIGWHGNVSIQYWRLTIEEAHGCCERARRWYHTLQAVTWFKRRRAAVMPGEYCQSNGSVGKYETSSPLVLGGWFAICPRNSFPELDDSIEEHNDSLWSPIIYARTSRVFMQTGQRLEPSQYGPAKKGGPARDVCSIYITNATGDISGVLLLNSLDDIPVGKPCELIYVSKARIDYPSAQGHFDDFPEFFYFHGDCEPECWLGYGRCKSRRPERGHYTFYNVLSIEWRNGIAYRVTCGRVFGSAWDAAEKEEIDVLLG